MNNGKLAYASKGWHLHACISCLRSFVTLIAPKAHAPTTIQLGTLTLIQTLMCKAHVWSLIDMVGSKWYGANLAANIERRVPDIATFRQMLLVFKIHASSPKRIEHWLFSSYGS